MARVAITEYAAKKLIFGDLYQGVSISQLGEKPAIPAGDYIVKVDTGVKKRGKQGLIRVPVAAGEVIKAATELFTLGYDRCLAEPLIPHETTAEHYLSVSLERDGVVVLQSDKGGVDVEDAAASDINHYTFSRETALADFTAAIVADVPLPHFLEQMQCYNFSFLEINPYILEQNGFIALDMAVEIDSAKESKLPTWAQGHVLHKKAVSPQEAAVLEQDARTKAALNLHTLNPNGSILTLLSGGGASLVALDSLVTAGLAEQVINYSEYSGAPTREETQVYVSTLLEVLFSSRAKNKVILVAGGVANFTDVMATFQGIVDAFTTNLAELKKQQVYVCVRRGGPNQEAGLAHLRDFLDKNAIPNDVNDPSLSLGAVGDLVKKHL